MHTAGGVNTCARTVSSNGSCIRTNVRQVVVSACNCWRVEASRGWMSRQSRWSKGGGDCTSSPSHLSLVRHSPARASNGGQTRVTSTQRRREDASERRTMGDRGGTGGGRPRARGEDPTATAFNPLYAGRSAGAASRGRGAGSEGKKGSEAEVWSDEELIYAEVFSARFGSADGGQERRCSSAELCGYLICPLTAVGLALGALVLAVLLLRGVLTPLELSKVPPLVVCTSCPKVACYLRRYYCLFRSWSSCGQQWRLCSAQWRLCSAQWTPCPCPHHHLQ